MFRLYIWTMNIHAIFVDEIIELKLQDILISNKSINMERSD